MGNLRFFLALSVVFAHTGSFQGFSFGDGRMAVQAFYIISGFYMSLVWNEKYQKLSNPIKTFYISRALRVYPLYFAVLIAALFMGLVAKSNIPAFHFFDAVNSLGWAKALWIYLTQLTLIGMESPLFLDFPLHKYMILPVAWTLGLELTFYLLVPFLLPQIITIISIMILSFILRLTFIFFSQYADTALYDSLWSYRFFPFEIALFLAGAFAYQIYVRVSSKVLALVSKPSVYFLVTFGMVAYLCYFKLLLSLLGEATYWLYYAMTFIAVPILFMHTKTSLSDRYIGELSYPMYISHIPILWVVARFFKSENIIYVVIPITLFVSILLSILQEHIDGYRHALIKFAQIKKSVVLSS